MSEFLPYGRQWIEDDDVSAVAETLRSDFLTQGAAVARFENALRDYCQARYCVAVANGTAALHIAVAALQIEPDAEGVTSPNTFAASANCMVYNNLRPTFADIDTRTYNVDPREIESRMTDRTKLVVAVHFAGQPADMVSIGSIARKHGLAVIEDAAHALGSTYEDGARVGSCPHSDMTVFSFHPVKTITTGEGGAITTNSEELYKRLRLLRSHGITRDACELEENPGPWYYEMQALGFNYRLTDLQAALGFSQLSKLPRFRARRREIVSRYNEAFRNVDFLCTPFEREGLDSTFHLYVLAVDFSRIGKTRKEVMETLKSKGIGTQVHYIPVHLHPYYRKRFGFQHGDFPKAESYYQTALSIPLYPKLTDGEVNYVIEAVKGLGCVRGGQ
jgi:UDP-4-amino-4,6-dideoxy-N-acetyl-beta-L-altrosamine transaminase